MKMAGSCKHGDACNFSHDKAAVAAGVLPDHILNRAVCQLCDQQGHSARTCTRPPASQVSGYKSHVAVSSHGDAIPKVADVSSPAAKVADVSRPAAKIADVSGPAQNVAAASPAPLLYSVEQVAALVHQATLGRPTGFTARPGMRDLGADTRLEEELRDADLQNMLGRSVYD
jgi:hypothetical protein